MKLGTTEISALYLGSNEIKKAYLGTNKVYEKISEIYFDDTISPTSWTEVIAKQEYTATNTLGIWTIKAENSYNTTNIPPNAFDNEGTYYFWQSPTIGNNATYKYLEIECPVAIKPISISIRHRYCGNNSYSGYLQAYNEDTSTWDNLGTLSISSGILTDDFTLSTNTFYKKFRVYTTRNGSSSASRPCIYLFNITEGYYKP